MRRQGGWTIWSILSVALLVMFFVLLFMKLFPPYFDNMKLKEALETVADDPRVTSLTRRQIIIELDDILYIDYAHEIVDLKKSLVIEKSKASMIMSVDYEVVVPLAYNISALLTFSNRVEKPLR